jgi:hypothetical protein
LALSPYLVLPAAAAGLAVSGSITWRALRTGIVPTRLGAFARADQPVPYWSAVGSSLALMAAAAALTGLYAAGRLG